MKVIKTNGKTQGYWSNRWFSKTIR